LFVAMLSCIGIFLILYEGYSRLENRVLDIAGVLLVCVAFVPMNLKSFELWGHVVPVQWQFGKLDFSVHGLCAVGFFVCIIYVSTILSGQSLKGRPSDVQCKWLIRYWSVSGVMALMMVAALIGHQLEGPWLHGRVVFLIETVGVVAFAIFWLMKTREVNPTIGYQLRVLNLLGTAAKETSQPMAKLERLGAPEPTGAVVATQRSTLCNRLQAVQSRLGG
jgi:hypothetical protein